MADRLLNHMVALAATARAVMALLAGKKTSMGPVGPRAMDRQVEPKVMAPPKPMDQPEQRGTVRVVLIPAGQKAMALKGVIRDVSTARMSPVELRMALGVMEEGVLTNLAKIPMVLAVKKQVAMVALAVMGL